jgi:hypothetical protein
MIFSLSSVKPGFPVFALFNVYRSTFGDTPVYKAVPVYRAALVYRAVPVCRAAASDSGGNFQV